MGFKYTVEPVLTATQGTGQNWPLYTGDRYIQVIVSIPKRNKRSAIIISFYKSIT